MNCTISFRHSALSSAIVAILFSHAMAIDVATGPLGSNIQAVRFATRNANETRDLGWSLNGAGINLGQIEPTRPGDQDLTNAGVPAFSELFHPAVRPGNPGTIGVGTVRGTAVPPQGVTAVSGTDDDVALGAHPTQVAGMMVSRTGHAGNIVDAQGNVLGVTNSVYGSAPLARLYASAWSQGPEVTNWAADVVRSAEWVRAQGGGVNTINYSFGLRQANSAGPGPVFPGPLDGNSLLARYIDYSARQHEVLHVISGNEDTFMGSPPRPNGARGDRGDYVPTDAYNGITVGATGQRSANGRYDEISNWNTTNNSSDGRFKTDIVAPGGSSYSVTLQGTNPGTGLVETRTVNVFPVIRQTWESTIASNTFVPTSDPLMTSLTDRTGNGLERSDLATYQRNAGTSFSAPQVSGVLALMDDYRIGRGAPPLSHLTKKASILNAASKHVLSKRVDTNGDFLSDAAGKSWTQRYEDRNAANPTFMNLPVDEEIGIGQLNGLSTMKQIANGGGGSAVSLELDTVAPFGSSTKNLYVGGPKLKPGSLVTATITWDRIVTNPAAGPAGGIGDLVNVDKYATQAVANPLGRSPELPDLDLVLVNRATGLPVAASASFRDNIEHVYFNIRDEGDYDLKVVNWSNREARYGMAFSVGTSNGLAFTVDTRSQGRQSPGPFGGDGPNDVNSLGHAGQGGFELGGEVFSSSLNATNMQRVSGALGSKSRVGPHLAAPAVQNLLDGSRGALGLQSGDQLMGLSWGWDGSVRNNAPTSSVITFSVDEYSLGLVGSSVNAEALAGTQPGDIFKTPRLDPFGIHIGDRLSPAAANSNSVHTQEHRIGLFAPNAGQSLLPGALADNLRDFEHDDILNYTDTDGDGMINNDAYFALSRFSPTVIAGGATAGDILVAIGQDPGAGFNLDAPAGGFNFNVFAQSAVIGLQPGDGIDPLTGDAIDGLILSRATLGIPHYVPLADQALFSLDPYSASVMGGVASAAAIYYTDFLRPFQPNIPWTLGGSLFASATDIGLNPWDNIDGLDIFAVPEPGALLLACLAAMPLVACRSRQHRRQAPLAA